MDDPLDLAQVFRDEWPRLVAIVAKDLGDLSLAEEAAQEAFVRAARRWPRDGRPDRPGAWLVTTARRIAIDHARRVQRLDARLPLLAEHDGHEAAPSAGGGGLSDPQLALILACCHPALAADAQVALTLRSVAGLSTEQIARAFVTSTDTMTRRLTRAKTKIRDAGIGFAAPTRARLVERLPAVSAVIEAIFSEGYASTSSVDLVHGDLCDEAVWLVELVAGLLPDEPEVHGLAALIALTDARRPARVDADGSLVVLAEQDRALWDQASIDRGKDHLGVAHRLGRLGPYQLQAAIAALHVAAESFEATNWSAIVDLFDVLVRFDRSPVVALNRAVAVSYRDGPEAGLAALDAIGDQLDGYHYAAATRAELLVRAGRSGAARSEFATALGATSNTIERRHLERRIAALDGA